MVLAGLLPLKFTCFQNFPELVHQHLGFLGCEHTLEAVIHVKTLFHRMSDSFTWPSILTWMPLESEAGATGWACSANWNCYCLLPEVQQGSEQGWSQHRSWRESFIEASALKLVRAIKDQMVLDVVTHYMVRNVPRLFCEWCFPWIHLPDCSCIQQLACWCKVLISSLGFPVQALHFIGCISEDTWNIYFSLLGIKKHHNLIIFLRSYHQFACLVLVESLELLYILCQLCLRGDIALYSLSTVWDEQVLGGSIQPWADSCWSSLQT